MLKNLPSDAPKQHEGLLPEANWNFTTKRIDIGSKQVGLLQYIIDITRRGSHPADQDSWIGQADLTWKKLMYNSREGYYRLEHLRLLGFLVKRQTGNYINGIPSFAYRLSNTYRQELEMAPLAPSTAQIELGSNFMAIDAAIGEQSDLLYEIVTLTRNRYQSGKAEPIFDQEELFRLAQSLPKVGSKSTSESYYRLEHLRLLGFLKKLQVGSYPDKKHTPRYSYQLSDAYRQTIQIF